MRNLAILLLSATVLLFSFAGCTAQKDVSSSSSPTESAALESSSEQAMDAIPSEIIFACDQIINAYFLDMSLYSDWEGSPIPSEDPPQVTNYALNNIERDGDILTVNVDLYGNLYIDPVTLVEDTWGYANVDIEASPLVFATSVVRLRDTAGGLAPVSCTYTPLGHPGLDYLKERTKELQPELAASERIDVSNYDAGLVDYIWRLVYSKRYIETPEDLTLYDLASITEGLELQHVTIGADTEDPNYRLDASLLTLLPNVESVTVYYYRLKDYGVFENMNDLKQLRIAWPGDELFATLRVGHTDRLWLDDPDTDSLDMTGINANALTLHSYTTAVRGFTGCENLQKLYISSTRTDMRLINAEAFPGIRYLNLYFYSDTPRIRDFSRLASFQDVKIDLYLSYQACNNPTLESLAGIALNDVYLDPENGSYPLQDLDASLIGGLTANRVETGMTMDFTERTGNEEIYNVKRSPVFREGPDGEAYEVIIGKERNGWTLTSYTEYDPMNPAFSIIARFSGEARLRGSIRIYSEEDGLMPTIGFTVAEESAHMMPYYEYDTRTMWFEITNGDMIKEFAGVDSGEFADCEITISNYEYVFAPMSVWNCSSVKEIHKIQ